ncbi:hypothetical protein TWF481_001527 [Arthrobotrys musiformis]|uniref:Uncharacterized protein n=1 Tax=Arthrobotrys musiformis TaxID=47236 RepID=A0AAV9WQY5_9PEZI
MPKVDIELPKMRFTTDNILKPWFKMLGLSRQSPPTWYRDRIREELLERRVAKTRLHKLSETSDVFFAISRARYDGFPIRQPPPFNPSHLHVYAYMLAKYSSRWGFYRAAAAICGADRYDVVREKHNTVYYSASMSLASTRSSVEAHLWYSPT